MNRSTVQAIDDLHRMAFEKEWWPEGHEPEAWMLVGEWLDDVAPLDFWRNTGHTRTPAMLSEKP